MSYNNKKFIILQEDDKGFGIKNRKPSGYTKIEPRDQKFKIVYYAQNLNEDSSYNLNLILDNEGKVEIISIGDIKSDSNGKIDICYDFDESLLDLVCGSAICVKDAKGEVKFPLSGFLSKKKIFNWKVNQFRGIKIKPFKKESVFLEKRKEANCFKKYEKNNNEVSSNEENNNEVNDVPMLDKVTDEDIEKDMLKDINKNIYKDIEKETFNEIYIEEFNKDDNFDDEIRSNKSFIMNMYNRLNDENEDFGENKQNEHESYEENVKKVIKSSKGSYEEAKEHIESLKKLLSKDDGKIENMVKSILYKVFNNKNTREIHYDYEYRFFFNILNEYEEINSISDDNYVFFKVYIDNFSQMKNMKKQDNIKYAIVYYPMMFMYPYFKNTGYFIIGLNYDKNNNISNLVYGIEVIDGMEECFPYDGKTGFNKYIYDYENSKGYHIMEYDYKKFCVK